MKRIAVLASGGGTNFQAILDGCADGRIDGRVRLPHLQPKGRLCQGAARTEGVPAYYNNRAILPATRTCSVYYIRLARSKPTSRAGRISFQLGPQTVRKWTTGL
jgi:folate-dependent phosphoribosylglycinamide formyltransferase PurN